MLRIFFTYILPLVAPSLLYLAWQVWKKKHPKNSDKSPVYFEKNMLFWCIMSGIILSGAILITLAFNSGFNPNFEIYVSPQLENGKVVGPIFKKVQ